MAPLTNPNSTGNVDVIRLSYLADLIFFLKLFIIELYYKSFKPAPSCLSC